MAEQEKLANSNAGLNFAVLAISQVEKEKIDNKSAMQQVATMMERDEFLNVRFNTDKNNIPYAWIESKGVKGFRMNVNNDNYGWLLDYVLNGPSEFDTDINEMSAEAEPLPGVDIQWEVLKVLIEENVRIQYVPSFRLQKDKISASATRKRGMIVFYLDRTAERIKYLAERKQTI